METKNLRGFKSRRGPTSREKATPVRGQKAEEKGTEAVVESIENLRDVNICVSYSEILKDLMPLDKVGLNYSSAEKFKVGGMKIPKDRLLQDITNKLVVKPNKMKQASLGSKRVGGNRSSHRGSQSGSERDGVVYGLI